MSSYLFQDTFDERKSSFGSRLCFQPKDKDSDRPQTEACDPQKMLNKAQMVTTCTMDIAQ